jgi:hypothetical protein
VLVRAPAPSRPGAVSFIDETFPTRQRRRRSRGHACSSFAVPCGMPTRRAHQGDTAGGRLRSRRAACRLWTWTVGCPLRSGRPPQRSAVPAATGLWTTNGESTSRPQGDPRNFSRRPLVPHNRLVQ